MAQTHSMCSPAPERVVEPYVYASEDDGEDAWSEWQADEPAPEPAHPEPVLDVQRLVDEAAANAFAAGQMEGMEEGRRLERAAHLAEDADRISRLAGAVEAFVAARQEIVQQFEPAVVRLALAVAARILRREAHTDPLLLSGAVRVALGQLASSAKIRLRVPAAEERLWEEWAAMLPNMGARLQVEAGEGMRLGDCIVETDLGSADLGVRAQLGEVDRTFFEMACKGENE